MTPAESIFSCGESLAGSETHVHWKFQKIMKCMVNIYGPAGNGLGPLGYKGQC